MCCQSFTDAVSQHRIVHDGTGWQGNGCCGQCFMLSELLCCPWCGTRLPAQPPPEQKRATRQPVASSDHIKAGVKPALRIHGQMTIAEVIERVKDTE